MPLGFDRFRQGIPRLEHGIQECIVGLADQELQLVRTATVSVHESRWAVKRIYDPLLATLHQMESRNWRHAKEDQELIEIEPLDLVYQRGQPSRVNALPVQLPSRFVGAVFRPEEQRRKCPSRAQLLVR